MIKKCILLYHKLHDTHELYFKFEIRYMMKTVQCINKNHSKFISFAFIYSFDRPQVLHNILE